MARNNLIYSKESEMTASKTEYRLEYIYNATPNLHLLISESLDEIISAVAELKTQPVKSVKLFKIVTSQLKL